MGIIKEEVSGLRATTRQFKNSEMTKDQQESLKPAFPLMIKPHPGSISLGMSGSIDPQPAPFSLLMIIVIISSFLTLSSGLAFLFLPTRCWAVDFLKSVSFLEWRMVNCMYLKAAFLIKMSYFVWSLFHSRKGKRVPELFSVDRVHQITVFIWIKRKMKSKLT